jgi:hypothetical protein
MAGGVASGLWAAQFVGPLLFQVEARDPATFIAAAGALVAAGRVGAGLACRTARSVDGAARRLIGFLSLARRRGAGPATRKALNVDALMIASVSFARWRQI